MKNKTKTKNTALTSRSAKPKVNQLRNKPFRETLVTTGEFKEVDALEDGVPKASILRLDRKNPKPGKSIYLSSGEREQESFRKTGIAKLHVDQELNKALGRYPTQKLQLSNRFHIRPTMPSGVISSSTMKKPVDIEEVQGEKDLANIEAEAKARGLTLVKSKAGKEGGQQVWIVRLFKNPMLPSSGVISSSTRNNLYQIRPKAIKPPKPKKHRGRRSRIIRG